MPRITHFKAHLPAYLALICLPLLLASSCDKNEIECDVIPYCPELDDYLPYEVGTLLAYQNLNTGDTVYFGCTSVERSWWQLSDDDVCVNVEYDRYNFNSSDPSIDFSVYSVYPNSWGMAVIFGNSFFGFGLFDYCALLPGESFDTVAFHGSLLENVHIHNSPVGYYNAEQGGLIAFEEDNSTPWLLIE